MKRLLLLCLQCTLIAALSAQIPNASFEEWETTTQATGWNSSFTFSRTLTMQGIPVPIQINYAAARRTTDAYSGNFAMQLTPQRTQILIQSLVLPGICQLGNFDFSIFEGDLTQIDPTQINWNSIITGGVAFHEIPVKMKARIKYLPDNDTCSIAIYATRNNQGVPEMIASGMVTISETYTTYTEIEVPVEVTTPNVLPDNLNVVFISSLGLDCSTNTELIIDAVTLETTTGLHDLTPRFFSVQPNPATAYVTLTPAYPTPYDISLMSMNGAVIQTECALQGTHQLYVGNLAKGIYLLQYKQNGQVSTEKIVVR